MIINNWIDFAWQKHQEMKKVGFRTLKVNPIIVRLLIVALILTYI
jgi:hypothetical protein